MKVYLAVALLIFFCGAAIASTYIGDSSSLCADQTYPNCFNPNCNLDEQFLNSDSTCYCRCGGLDAGQRRGVVDGTFVESNSRQFDSGLGSLQVNSFGSSGNIVDAGTGSGRRFVDVVGSGDRLLRMFDSNVGRQNPFAGQVTLGTSGVGRVEVGVVSGLGNVAVSGNVGRRVAVTRPLYSRIHFGVSSSRPADVGRQVRVISSVGQNVGRSRVNQLLDLVQEGSVPGLRNLWNDIRGSSVSFGGAGSRQVEVAGSGVHQIGSVGSGSRQFRGIISGGRSDNVNIFNAGVRDGTGAGRVFDSSVSDGVDTGVVDTVATGGFDARMRRQAGY